MKSESPSRRHQDQPDPSSAAAQQRMKANRSHDTGPELAVQRLLTEAGLVYETQYAPLRGVRRRADIGFPDQQVVVFIDGCFWHGCPLHGTWPKQNATFWRDKIETNQRRDADTNERFTAQGWRVLRFWTHDAPTAMVAIIVAIVQAPLGHGDADRCCEQ